MRLEASSFYSQAIDVKAAPDEPESKPRAGTLVLWDRTVIGAGSSESELERGMSDAFETTLKEFFSLYLESR
jgi:hypothetical protein